MRYLQAAIENYSYKIAEDLLSIWKKEFDDSAKGKEMMIAFLEEIISDPQLLVNDIALAKTGEEDGSLLIRGYLDSYGEKFNEEDSKSIESQVCADISKQAAELLNNMGEQNE